MAKLSITDASHVAGVARSTLYRAIQTGRLSADPDGRLDTAELLRAGYTLQRSAQQRKGGALHDAPPRSTGAQQSSAPTDTQALQVMQQERDMLRLERDMLRQQLAAAQMREQAALEREREAREERQAAREREALLLRMVEQTQQRYDRLLEAPRPSSSPRPELCHPEPRTAGSPRDPRGDMRRRIVALLREHPEGLTPAEIRGFLGVDRPLADTLLGMRRDGLVRRVGYGRYMAAEPRRMPPTSARQP
jgi:hypothetical protein